MLKAVGGVNTTPSGTLLLISRKEATQTDLIKQLRGSALRATGSGAADSNVMHLNNSSAIGGISDGTDLPAIANSFLLGYTFVETRDYDDKLAHLDIYTAVGDADERAYRVLLRDFMEKQYRSSTRGANSTSSGSGGSAGKKEGKLVVGLVVDWNENVNDFVRFLGDWLRLLRQSVEGLASVASVEAELKHRLQTYVAPDGTTSSAIAGASSSLGSGDASVVELPLEEGQYDVPLGFDLVLIAGNAQNVLPDAIGAGSGSDNASFSDDLVDYVQQVLRTIALTHGASLIYVPATSHLEEGATNRDALATLVGERLQIPLVGELGAAVPSVVDQSGILVPAGWDSVGKILALREGFPDNLRQIWARTIAIDSNNNGTTFLVAEETVENFEKLEENNAAVMYERTINKLHSYGSEAKDFIGARDNTHANLSSTRDCQEDTPRTDFQEFLAGQYDILESRIKKEQESSPFKRNARQFGGFTSGTAVSSTLNGSGFQGVPHEADINIGGIQVEGVEEVLRRLKIQETIVNKESTISRSTDSTPDILSLKNVQSGNIENINSTHGQMSSTQPTLNLASIAHANNSGNSSHIGLSGVSSTTARFSSVGTTTSGNALLANNVAAATKGSRLDDSSSIDRPNSQTEVLSNFFQNILDRNRQ